MIKRKVAVQMQQAWFVAGLGATNYQKYILIGVILAIWLSMCAFNLWGLVDSLD